MTHAYFSFYHTLSNLLIRRTRHALRGRGALAQGAAEAAVVLVLAYATAYGETLTIAHFPYYTFKVSGWMETYEGRGDSMPDARGARQVGVWQRQPVASCTGNMYSALGQSPVLFCGG
jgi:hypothetical protein